MSTDRNLLFGILALQMSFVSRDQLVGAMNAWVLDKHKSLGEILREQGFLPAERLQLLDALVNEHLKTHNNNPEESLAALSSVKSAKRLLAGIGDNDVQASLMRVGYRSDEVTTDAPPPTTTRYQILRPHAKGGLGEVFVAQDGELHREVALKEIQLGQADNPNSRERFVLEAEITGGLEHPGIVPVYGLGTYGDGRPFYAMKFIRGDSLKEAIKRFHQNSNADSADSRSREAICDNPRNMRLSFDSPGFRQLLRRFTDVCNAIAYAHSRGVLHRDMKPGNVMLGKFGETLVVDWGLAKAGVRENVSEPERPARENGETPLIPHSGSGIAETIAGSAIGTPTYMSPEQAEGKVDQLGPTTDVYSLGATLFCLLTNRAPVEGDNIADVLRKVQRGDVGFNRNADYADERREGRSALRKSAQSAFRIPPPLIAITRKAMALCPADRYATPLALAADIDHWLADEPVSAYPEPFTVRARRWARKHPGITTGLAATVLVGTLGLAVGLYFVTAEKNRTELARQGEETQRIAAQESEEKAKTEAATATAVKNFLQYDLLQLAAARTQKVKESSGVRMDPDLTVRDLVLRAAQKIEGKFENQPLVEAAIRRTLGWTLNEIGRPDLAIVQDARARRLYTENLGPDHPDTLRSMLGLGIWYLYDGHPQEALKLQEETLELMKARLGPEHFDTLQCMNNLGECYTAVGRTQDAIKLQEETFRLQKATLGPDHPNTLWTMTDLAHSYDAVKRSKEALNFREEALQLTKARFGPDHPDTLLCMHNLSHSYAAAGRSQEALKLREETLQQQITKLGPHHPHTLVTMNNLAHSYEAAGRAQEALKLREETLRLQKANSRADYSGTLVTMHNLANSYANAGREREALQLREETLRLSTSKLGRNHPDTLGRMNSLALSYMVGGRPAEAVALLQEVLVLRLERVRAEPDSVLEQAKVAWTQTLLGRAEQTRFDFGAAVSAYTKAVELFTKLDKTEELKAGFFRNLFNFSREQIPVCRKADQVVKDVDFALKQPAAEAKGLLDLRVQVLEAKKDRAGIVATAEAYAKLDQKGNTVIYNAACAWSKAAGLAAGTPVADAPGSSKTPGANATGLAEEYAGKAMALLRKTPTGPGHFAPTRAALAAYMKQDKALDPLRQRDDFKKLLAELEGKANEKPAAPEKK
jgi:serine/threonine protein kinase/tetratricopeptide (TPR) repeat protein